MGRGEAVDDAVPEPAVDEVAVDEDDGLARARFAIADAPRRQIDLPTLIAHSFLRSWFSRRYFA
jgi:hypothetical protein